MKVQTSRYFLAKLAARRRLRSLFFVPLASAVMLGSHRMAANTADTIVSGQTDLTAAATYSAGLPTTASDVTFSGTYSPAAFTVNSSVTFGTLDDLSTTAITISNTGAAASTLTLGGAGNTGNATTGANAADLLFVNTGGSLTISPGAGVLGIALGQSGNFNVVGAASITPVISGTGFGITKLGAGTLILSGANLFSGGTTVTAGQVTLANNAALGTGTVSLNGGNLALNNGITFASSVALTAATATFNQAANATITGAYSTSGAGVGGTLNVGGTSVFSLSGANFTSFNGTLAVTGAATLRVTSATNIGTFTSTTLDLGNAGGQFTNNVGGSTGQTFVIGALSGGTNSFLRGSSSAANRTDTFQIGAKNTNSTFAGVISNGTGATVVTTAVNKVGTGTLTLSGANTYTGTTTVSGGMLTLTATGTLGSGNIILADVAGVGLTLGNTTAIGDNAILTFGASAVILLNGAGSETLGLIVDSTSGVTLSTPGTYTAAQLNSNFGVTSFSGTETFTVTGVPEPSTVGLLLAGGLAGGVLLRRRRATNRVGVQQV